ncbi:MAG: NADH-quinone oxidoreductase subunit NuoF [Candidatus Sumerlaeota bacterium]|nr:NADH-quinone oxidoreductase subunit NuoF [Candidatus Sumerlaeota bacterium]
MTTTPLTQNIRPGREPLSLKEYEAAGGYQALRKAIKELSPTDVQTMVKDARLLGRGGAGFPTGLKWSFVPMGPDAPRPKYLLCNADEMEPGTFKDRLLIEGDPHQLVEGMIVASYAIQADVAFIFLRAQYDRGAERLRRAIAEAYSAGYLGKNILGTGFCLELQMHESAGRYICGEETALLNSLEGRRAIPRTKPPFPPVVGLWGKPTVVQNVETICNVPHIVNGGVSWYRALSRCEDGGTKIYGVSGKVNRPGAWELPLGGVTVRQLIEERAGGMRDGLKCRGVLPGGASTDFLVEQHFDTPMDFKSVAKAGSRLGTGTMIVLDDQTCPVGMVLNLTHFFATESCGWCTPCREGLPYMENMLRAIEEGRGEERDLAALEEHCRWLGPGMTFCPLAPGAVEPVQSALKYFRDDFERHVREKRCPWR